MRNKKIGYVHNGMYPIFLGYVGLPGVGDVSVACLSLGEDSMSVVACSFVGDVDPGSIAFPNELIEIAKTNKYFE